MVEFLKIQFIVLFLVIIRIKKAHNCTLCKKSYLETINTFEPQIITYGKSKITLHLAAFILAQTLFFRKNQKQKNSIWIGCYSCNYMVTI
jgi:hypothetical protein